MSHGAREIWRIDPDRSALRFSIRRALMSDLRGQFDCWGGVVLFDRRYPRRSSVRVWIDLSSIETGSPKDDEQVLATGLFDSHWEPGAAFEGDNVTIADLRHGVVSGRLSLRSASQIVAVSVYAEPSRISAAGEYSRVWGAHASLDRRSFGLHRQRDVGDWLDEAVLAKTIDVKVHIEAVRDGTSVMQPDPKLEDLSRPAGVA